VVLNDSLLNLSKFKLKFNIILAEGVLNVVGFDRGLRILLENLKNPGYLIIHDEYQNDSQKRMRFNKNQLDLVASFKLDKNIWWNEYYSCLEKKIDEIGNNSLFHKEINEINEYKINSEKFESIFYVLKNRI
jgi:hypothetical protein